MVCPNNVPVFFSAPPPPKFPKLKDIVECIQKCLNFYANLVRVQVRSDVQIR